MRLSACSMIAGDGRGREHERPIIDVWLPRHHCLRCRLSGLVQIDLRLVPARRKIQSLPSISAHVSPLASLRRLAVSNRNRTSA